MKAFTYSPAEIFGSPIRYVVPLFQRPYVWNEEDQWQPLWEDILALTDRVAHAPSQPVYGAPAVAPHFLGAVVIEQHLSPVEYLQVRHVIDGQQRLTTLQIVLDAAQEVTQDIGRPVDAKSLLGLVENDLDIAPEDQRFKVWPTDRDQAAFRACMTNGAVVGPDMAASKIAQAHAFFVSRIRAWATDTPDEQPGARLASLSAALRNHLRMVVIDLEPGDNAQVIFETLNHRGSRLLAADLVKNLLFQMASSAHLDVTQLYRKHWQDLDSDYWRTDVVQGRLKRPRIDVFLNRWLTMKLLRDVMADRIFTDFRELVQTMRDPDVAGLMAEIAHDARVYQSLESLPPASVEGRFHYRVLRAMDTQVVDPLLIWLMRFPEADLPLAQRHKALRAIESWLVRRFLVGATAKDYNRMVLDLLKQLVRFGPSVAGDTAESELSKDPASTRYWPDDEEVVRALTNARVYRHGWSKRLRMLLEALEDASRTRLGEGSACPRDLTVEHVMPQGWREHWGESLAGNPDAEAERDHLIHTLGNLTLVTGKLNPSLSNRPWTAADCVSRGLPAKGKRDLLLEHSELKINAKLVSSHADAWSEASIRERTSALAHIICEIWPCPTDVARPHSPDRADMSDPSHHASESASEPAGGRWLLRGPDGVRAIAFGVDDAITVVKGSLSRVMLTPGAQPKSYERLQADLVRTGVLQARGDGILTFTQDHTFASLSAAATVCLGRAANGRKEWRLDQSGLSTAPAGPTTTHTTDDSSGQDDTQSDQALRREFHDLMRSVYQRTRSEVGYDARAFIGMVSAVGGVEAASRLTTAAHPSDGFTVLWEAGRLDLTVEAHVVLPRYESLFREDVVEQAHTRLRDYGFVTDTSHL